MPKRNKIPRQSGFTLVELILTMSIMIILGVMAISKIKRDNEDIVAKAAGEQMRTVADALDSYISRRYFQLQNVQSSPADRYPGDGDAPAGGRVCDASGCTITIGTLRYEGMLASTHLDQNVYGAGYVIRILRRATSPTGCGSDGAMPCYALDGVAVTDTPFYLNTSDAANKKVRYDLLGAAVQYGGPDVGATDISSGGATLFGLKGAWTALGTEFPAINKLGLLGARKSYQSSKLDDFLRRDGTLPMTGDLNMGPDKTNNIDNANNVYANRIITGDPEMPSVIYGIQDGANKHHTVIQQGGELRVADAAGNPGVIRAKDMYITNRANGQVPLSLLLPKQALRGSYWVTNNTVVPKPYCVGGPGSANGSNGNVKPRITLTPGMQHILTMAHNRHSRDGEANYPSDAIWSAWAVETADGSGWQVKVASYSTNNCLPIGSSCSDGDGNSSMYISEANDSFMLAQTYCDYGGARDINSTTADQKTDVANPAGYQ